MSDTVVDRFLASIAAGAVPDEGLYAPGVRVDATVPGWRFSLEGPEAVVAEYRRWFDHPSRFVELDRQPLPGGELVRYLHAWEEDGDVKAAHHVHLLQVEGDRIVHDTVFCGGRWASAALAQMGLTVHAD